MLTLDGGWDPSYRDLLIHEVGHNWFYGILGSNERDHGWMDEGVNSFNEQRYMAKKHPPDSVQPQSENCCNWMIPSSFLPIGLLCPLLHWRRKDYIVKIKTFLDSPLLFHACRSLQPMSLRLFQWSWKGMQVFRFSNSKIQKKTFWPHCWSNRYFHRCSSP